MTWACTHDEGVVEHGVVQRLEERASFVCHSSSLALLVDSLSVFCAIWPADFETRPEVVKNNYDSNYKCVKKQLVQI